MARGPADGCRDDGDDPAVLHAQADAVGGHDHDARAHAGREDDAPEGRQVPAYRLTVDPLRMRAREGGRVIEALGIEAEEALGVPANGMIGGVGAVG